MSQPLPALKSLSLALSTALLLGACQQATPAPEGAATASVTAPAAAPAAAAPAGGGFPEMPSTAQTDYRAGLYVVDGKVVKDRTEATAFGGGQVKDGGADNLAIATQGRNDFNAVLVRGNGQYTLSHAKLDLHGDGSNDFLGLGAGAMVEGGATLVIRDSSIQTYGVIASTIAALSKGVLKVYDSTLHAHGGPLPPGYVPHIGPGMMEVPAPLKITGTARAALTAGDSKSYFYNSTVIADGWGALSTDAPGASYLEANDTIVKVNNSGYGTYADHDCTVVINRGSFDVPSYAGVVAGPGSLTFNGLKSMSHGNTVMIHSVMGKPAEISKLAIKGGQYRSDSDAILVKSANADIEIDGATLEAGNGVLVHAIVNDDRAATKVNGEQVSGVRVSLAHTQVEGNIVHEDGDRHMQLSLKDSRLKGAIHDAEVSLDSGSRWLATGNSRVLLAGSVQLAQIDAPTGVTIEAVAGQGSTLTGTQRLASGGTLKITQGQPTH
ncbi:hypothetical protein [Pseudoxanthomonas sp.]|uniref:hypothetical protein n=1 Tax=Pseudoxanthomonas sp. TaxID=1871049 RepID=UPI0026283408|nr:hypothetical protein [Pseudoxanthomonas sp.]WDS35038.1 MAG: hypothetical protein O8I58_11710 [Pseudoxanthomonas sp.]